MGQWNVNDSKKIAYRSKDGNVLYAKKVYFVNRYGKYQVWPGDVYATDIEICDISKNDGTVQSVYTYKVVNGNPTYIQGSKSYSGLPPGRSYTIRGTVVIQKYNMSTGTNELYAEYKNCYFHHLTSSSSPSNNAYCWLSTNSSFNITNNIVNRGHPIGLFTCDLSNPTNNTGDWCASHMGYMVFDPETQGMNFLTIQPLGVTSSTPIKLKRLPITTSLNARISYNEQTTYRAEDWVGFYVSGYLSWEGSTGQDSSITIGHTTTGLTYQSVENNIYYFTVNTVGVKTVQEFINGASCSVTFTSSYGNKTFNLKTNPVLYGISYGSGHIMLSGNNLGIFTQGSGYLYLYSAKYLNNNQVPVVGDNANQIGNSEYSITSRNGYFTINKGSNGFSISPNGSGHGTDYIDITINGLTLSYVATAAEPEKLTYMMNAQVIYNGTTIETKYSNETLSSGTIKYFTVDKSRGNSINIDVTFDKAISCTTESTLPSGWTYSQGPGTSISRLVIARTATPSGGKLTYNLKDPSGNSLGSLEITIS